MPNFDPNDYGPVLALLVAIERRRPLDAGAPDSSSLSVLHRLAVETAFAHTKVVDGDMAACCIAGVWLLHDFLDESHAISQSIDTPPGSYWHAVMHRREGDFSNAKYWLRRAGQHPVFAHVAASLRSKIRRGGDANSSLGETRPRGGDDFDPFAFVDRCEAALRSKPADRDACRDIQQVEWESLFDFCYNAAVSE